MEPKRTFFPVFILEKDPSLYTHNDLSQSPRPQFLWGSQALGETVVYGFEVDSCSAKPEMETRAQEEREFQTAAAMNPIGKQPSSEAGFVVIDAVQTDLWSRSRLGPWQPQTVARPAAALCPSLPSK